MEEFEKVHRTLSVRRFENRHHGTQQYTQAEKHEFKQRTQDYLRHLEANGIIAGYEIIERSDGSVDVLIMPNKPVDFVSISVDIS